MFRDLFYDSFCFNEEKEQVAVYDKHKNKGFVTSIGNIMAENRFNDFDFEEFIISFEPIASKVEDLSLPTYQRVIETRRLNGSPDEKADLAFLIAFQMLRTKAARERFQEMEAAMREKVEAMGRRMEDIKGWEPATEDRIKRQHLMVIRDAIPDYAGLIALKEFRLAEAALGRSFYLGDNPVCLHNYRTFGPYGNLGLAVPGIQIYLPLSSNLMLCAWCPSVMEDERNRYTEKKKEATSELLGQVIAGRISASTMKETMEAFRQAGNKLTEKCEAATTGIPILFDADNMDFCNSLQTGNAYRYVICQKADFDLAKRYNEEFPHSVKDEKLLTIEHSGSDPPLALVLGRRPP